MWHKPKGNLQKHVTYDAQAFQENPSSVEMLIITSGPNRTVLAEHILLIL